MYWSFSQPVAYRDDKHLQEDGALLHWHLTVKNFLKEQLLNEWIGHAGRGDQMFCKFHARSPDLNVSDDVTTFVRLREDHGLCTTASALEQISISISKVVCIITADMLLSNQRGADWCL